MNHIILLNMTGDITIGWTDEQSENMRKLIEEKLKTGCSFFILKKTCLGLFKTKVKVRNISEVKDNEIIIGDASLSDMFINGLVSAGKTPSIDYSDNHQSDDVEEILNNDSMLINPIAGG